MGEQRTYTAVERGRIIKKIREQLNHGKSVAATAGELGITQGIYYRWLREAAREPRVAGGSRRRGRPESERAKIVATIRARIARGEKTERAAKAEGISDATFYNWARELAASKEPRMRPVTVTADSTLALAVAPARPAEPEPLSLVAPGGYRIEGLSVEAAAALLRALA